MQRTPVNRYSTPCIVRTRAIGPDSEAGPTRIEADWRRKSKSLIIFFFQAEDGIRDLTVTGVQTCALPILLAAERLALLHVVADARETFEVFPDVGAGLLASDAELVGEAERRDAVDDAEEIGRASCRERV